MKGSVRAPQGDDEWRSGDRVEIVDGLKEGERAVSAEAFLVDWESRLKSPRTFSQQTQPCKIELSKAGLKIASKSGQVKDANLEVSSGSL